MTTPGTNRCSDCRQPRAAVRLDDCVLCDGCADRRLASMTRHSATDAGMHSTGFVLAAASACLLLASLVARRSAQPSPA